MHSQTPQEAVDEIAEFLGVSDDKKSSIRVLLKNSEKPITLESLKTAVEKTEASLK